MHFQDCIWHSVREGSEESDHASRLYIIIWMDTGHGIQLDQVSDLWLLQDRMGTSSGGVNAVALMSLVICHAGIPPSRVSEADI